MRRLSHFLTLLAAVAASPTYAGDFEACGVLADDAARLACYDRAAGRAAPPPAAPPAQTAVAPPPAAHPDTPPTGPLSSGDYRPQTLPQRWELDPQSKDGILKIKPYQPVYLLPVNWRRNVNESPCSPNPANCAIGAGEGTQNVEAKFQFSFKTKAWQDILGTPLDLWLAYTQQSFWQVYNSENSRPFRENDFQPETWVTMPLSLGFEALRLRMLNVGLVHQSNGQSDPLSRSWNRVYATFGFAAGDASILVKPWWRLSESSANDNNPDILDYLGRAEVQLIKPLGAHVLSASLRNNLKFGSSDVPNRTSITVEWAFPLYGALHGYVQAFNGWGDSLQNYNFHNTSLGVGVSLVQWR
jgi:phospholipase A1